MATQRANAETVPVVHRCSDAFTSNPAPSPIRDYQKAIIAKLNLPPRQVMPIQETLQFQASFPMSYYFDPIEHILMADVFWLADKDNVNRPTSDEEVSEALRPMKAFNSLPWSQPIKLIMLQTAVMTGQSVVEIARLFRERDVRSYMTFPHAIAIQTSILSHRSIDEIYSYASRHFSSLMEERELERIIFVQASFLTQRNLSDVKAFMSTFHDLEDTRLMSLLRARSVMLKLYLDLGDGRSLP